MSFSDYHCVSEFASSIGLSLVAATLGTSLLNTASRVGMKFIWVAHRSISYVDSFNHFGTWLGHAGWSFALFQSILYLFAIICGIFAGGNTSTWIGRANELQKDSPQTQSETALIIATSAAGRGSSCVVSGPKRERLLGSGAWQGLVSIGAYRTKTGSLVLFRGVTVALGSLSVCERFSVWTAGGGNVECERDESGFLIGLNDWVQ